MPCPPAVTGGRRDPVPAPNPAPERPDPHEAAVLIGDFNMWRWVTRFVVPGWRDTVRGATWPASRPLFQIDHVLTTQAVTATDAEVVVAGHSDHLPIRARVALA